MLRGGQVFEGQITQVGNTYIVNIPNGEMRFHASEVEYSCASLAEVYQRKQAAVAPDDLDERLRLVQWCLKQKLHAEAGQQLDAIAARQPGHPLVAMFRQRLDLMRQPPPAAKPAPLASVPKSSTAELDRFVRNLPDGTMEAFTLRVQPVLMNHCATSGCHGPGATAKFQLLRVGNPQTAARRVTQQNLLAVLAQVNAEQPATSPLLAVPARPHGPLPAAVFTDPNASSYRNLIEWVQIATWRPTVNHADVASLALPGHTAGQAQLAGATEPLPPAITLEGSAPVPSGRTSATHRPRAQGSHAKKSASNSALPPDKTRSGGTGASPAASTNATVDPFDPDVFNRRYATPHAAPAAQSP